MDSVSQVVAPEVRIGCDEDRDVLCFGRQVAASAMSGRLGLLSGPAGCLLGSVVRWPWVAAVPAETGPVGMLSAGYCGGWRQLKPPLV